MVKDRNKFTSPNSQPDLLLPNQVNTLWWSPEAPVKG